jgi:hypothetical protein
MTSFRHIIIETRFCVTKKVTKTGPKHLGGGGDKRRIVGCIHLRMHHCSTTKLSVGDKPKDGAFQAGTGPYGEKGIAKTAFLIDTIRVDLRVVAYQALRNRG